jgi:hypothetical protein
MNELTYKRTQSAHILVSILLVSVLGGLFLAGISMPQFWVIGIILALIGFLFSSLTVIVDKTAVYWYFGPGFWRKTIALDEIIRVRSVRNKWWYGWGIRYTPHGWLYNVYGLGAVELHLADGKKLRVGTDEPDSLRRTIESVCARSH